MTDEDVRKELDIAFEYCYAHDDWVNPLNEALDGISAQAALWRPSPEGKGIWDIVLHLAVWNENIVERTETRQKTHPSEGPWPPPPSSPDEEAWMRHKKRLTDSIEAVRKMIQTRSLDDLQAAPYGLGDLLCRMTHMSYHLGQITKLREIVALPD